MHLLSGCRTVGFFVCAVCLLNACGGNGGSSGVPKPVLINYSVGGTVSGLASSASVVLQNNGGNTTTVSTNGSFIFSMQVSGGAGYGVTVVRQPPAQTCSVTGGTGIGITSSVSSIKVNCNVAIESVVHTFGLNADGLNPNSNVVKATDGNFYGVTSGGGTNLLGTVFKIAPTGTETVLYSFAGGTNDGSAPVAALVQGRDGNFYGTTTGGGANGNGTVFKLTPIGVLTVLYSFAAVPSNVGGPSSALIQGSDGNFYGTTSNGGTYNLGTFYQITPVGIETVIHSFSGILGDGSKPNAAVVQGADGNFYGTTSSAGAANGGTVFKVTPAGVETILHSFPLFATYDGCIPYAELIQAADGNFYGTTGSGGPANAGTVFKITPLGVETVLYFFLGSPTDGLTPFSALVQGIDGDFYGTTRQGGASDLGTVYKILPTGVETVLHSVTGGIDGNYWEAALLQGSDGNFYSTTHNGGASLSGSLIKITIAGGETVVYSFNSAAEGQIPVGLIQAIDGNFYGTTSKGGTSGNGTVFRVTAAGAESVLYSFARNTTDGGQPEAPLIQATDGNFYGTTAGGGTSGNGTVYKVTAGGVESMLYSFSGGTTDGSFPQSALIQASDGNFYGTTYKGGTTSNGTVFKVTPAGIESLLYSFSGSVNDGSQPQAGLIQASDGNFYGTTFAGGENGKGTVFKITPTGAETILHSFTFNTLDGNGPQNPLIQANDGSLYGTTIYGGGVGTGTGTLFKITTDGVETVLHYFGNGASDGSSPQGALQQGSDGNFYGVTSGGGTNGSGVLFGITPVGIETVLYSFRAGSDGSSPTELIQGKDGIFYGTTVSGGSSNLGTVFAF